MNERQLLLPLPLETFAYLDRAAATTTTGSDRSDSMHRQLGTPSFADAPATAGRRLALIAPPRRCIPRLRKGLLEGEGRASPGLDPGVRVAATPNTHAKSAATCALS